MKWKDKIMSMDWEWSRDDENGIIGLAAICMLIFAALIMIVAPVSVRHVICMGTLILGGAVFGIVTAASCTASVLIMLRRYWTKDNTHDRPTD